MKNTPVLEVIDNWVVDSIMDYLEETLEAKYYWNLRLVSLKTLQLISESLLLTYEDINDLNKDTLPYRMRAPMISMGIGIYNALVEKNIEIEKSKNREKKYFLHKSITKDCYGYMHKYAPDHPKAHGKRVRLHILIMEGILGRRLYRNEVVHHINFDKSDNRPRNLVVLTRKEHSILHSGTIKNLVQSNDLIWTGSTYEINKEKYSLIAD